MKVGFTGTRKGMAPRQKAVFAFSIGRVCAECPSNETIEFHFGDCEGSDEEAAILMQPYAWTVSHPPIKDRYRAYFDADEIREPEDYIPRNHNIVDEIETLFATPATHKEQQRSGTWATVRYARSQKKRTITIYPDGTKTETTP